MDALFIGLVLALWLATSLLVYSVGFTRGWRDARAQQRWDRWFMKSQQERQVKF